MWVTHLQQLTYLSDLDGTRTHDPILKRDMLYLLSYEVDLIYRSFESIAERLGSDPNAPKCTICLAGSPYSL